MKKAVLILLSLFWVSTQDTIAKHVPAEDARKAAISYLQQQAPLSIASNSSLSLTLVHQEASKAVNPSARQAPVPYYYVFSMGENKGLIFMAADDKALPVLGYTNVGNYDPAALPPHFLKWLETYKNDIRFAMEQLPENTQAQQQWQELLSGKKAEAATRLARVASKNPLLATTWNQSPYYNALCPYDNAANQRTVSGCVATAMAQIMKYWQYPAKGSGFHSYNHSKYGTLSANFSNTTYDWASMPNNVTSNNTAVATLMQQVGVSVDMDYDVASNGGSGAYVISSASPVQHCSEYALKTYFGYKEVQGVQRAHYTLSNWINLLKAELDANRPILYAGFGGGGGHAFVCDGYNSNDMFHMNWGWEGYYDGYFAISALNPDGLGTGGGTGGYNSGQQAVINIKAPAAAPQTTDMQLDKHVTISNSSISFGQAFTVHTGIINKGTGTFTGDYAAAAFDENGNFIDFVKTYTGNELQGGFHYPAGVDFGTEGMATLLPGTYQIYMFYRANGGEWEQLKGQSYTSSVSLQVVNNNPIDLSSTLAVQNVEQLYQGKQVSVTTSVRNRGTGNFTGWVDLSLYQLDGTFAYTIDQKQLENFCAGCNSVQAAFENAKLDVEPGTYLLAMTYYTDADGWRVAGSSQFQNPVKVVVKVAPLSADAFEDNDAVAKSHKLPLQFTTNTASLFTDGSNIHVGTDYDFYKVDLPAGNKYELSVRVHDSYSSATSQTYTNDVLFSLSSDGQEWTDAFDSVLPSSFEMEGGQTLYVAVAPYFQGETGTYLLDVQVMRKGVTGIEDDFEKLAVQAYPNPTTGILHLQAQKGTAAQDIISITGQVMMKIPAGTTQVDLTHFTPGIYLLRTEVDGQYQVQKIMKQ